MTRLAACLTAATLASFANSAELHNRDVRAHDVIIRPPAIYWPTSVKRGKSVTSICTECLVEIDGWDPIRMNDGDLAVVTDEEVVVTETKKQGITVKNESSKKYDVTFSGQPADRELSLESGERVEIPDGSEVTVEGLGHAKADCQLIRIEPERLEEICFDCVPG